MKEINSALEKIKQVHEIVKNQERWRREECINLIASESVLSPLAEKFFINDFEGRYNEHSEESHYCGTKFANDIEEFCKEIFMERFSTRFVDVRPISGAVANMTIYYAFTKPFDNFISLGIQNGAHVSATRWGVAGFRGLKNIDAYFDEKRMNIDVDATAKLARRVEAKLIMLGGSLILFPQPIKELRESLGNDFLIVYDAAHVFGLIYAKEFQEPLKEGADIITSSTHKTFQGPQGGIILARDSFEEDKWKKIENAIFPGLISNHHIHRLPALAITALEMNIFGKEYAKQVIRNAKAFAEELYNLGFDVLCPDLGFTESHQVIVNVKSLGGGRDVANRLEEANIICNKMSLPSDSPHDATKNPSGIRFGVQEVTRFGMKEEDMKEIARFIKKLLIDKISIHTIKQEVIEFRKRFKKIHYCFNFEDI
ncbi:MAG: serine hydroxymethyltransferase [Candidatus Aenigmatarchaeota archaeon]